MLTLKFDLKKLRGRKPSTLSNLSFKMNCLNLFNSIIKLPLNAKNKYAINKNKILIKIGNKPILLPCIKWTHAPK